MAEFIAYNHHKFIIWVSLKNKFLTLLLFSYSWVIAADWCETPYMSANCEYKTLMDS